MCACVCDLLAILTKVIAELVQSLHILRIHCRLLCGQGSQHVTETHLKKFYEYFFPTEIRTHTELPHGTGTGTAFSQSSFFLI